MSKKEITPSGNGEEPLKSIVELNRSHRKTGEGLSREDGREESLLLWSWSYVLNAWQKMHDSHLKQNAVGEAAGHD